MKQYNGDINLKNTTKAPRNILKIFFLDPVGSLVSTLWVGVVGGWSHFF